MHAKNPPNSRIEGMFRLGKVFQKYLVAHILSLLYGEHALNMLWHASKRSRAYLIANLKMLNKNYLAKPFLRMIDQSKLGIDAGWKKSYMPKEYQQL